MNFFIGQIQSFAFNFAPRSWMQCNGQILSIANYQTLFALIGTTYGGDGVQTFALPDLRGRTSLHQGQGPGLSDYEMGQAGGSEEVTLLVGNLPTHMHQLAASKTGNMTTPAQTFFGPAATSDGSPVQAYGPTTNVSMSPRAVSMAGGNQPHENMQPFLVINWCIAVEGIFPSRN